MEAPGCGGPWLWRPLVVEAPDCGGPWLWRPLVVEVPSLPSPKSGPGRGLGSSTDLQNGQGRI